MADSKTFKLMDGVTCEMIGRQVEAFLREKKNMMAEGTKTQEGYFVQAKQEDGWKKIAGMSMAIQVQIMQAGDKASVNIGSGKWSDKVGAAAAGMIIFAPLAVTAAIGALGQKKLPEEIFDCIEQFIMSGGKSVIVSMSASQALKENQVLCPGCKAPNEKGTAFCASCGTKLGAQCPHCKASVELGVKFCSACGGAMEVKKLCAVCGAEITGDKKFCAECGAPTTAQMECAKCHTKVPEGKKFCPECGNSMTGKRNCPGCGAEIENEKFCPECGASTAG